MKDTEASPLGWKLLQRAQKHFPCIAVTTSIAAAFSTSIVRSPSVRGLFSSPSHGTGDLHPGRCFPGMGTAVVLGVGGAKAPVSSLAVTSFACALACAEPVRLIRGARCGQLAGIFASFNSQSSQEPGEGLSAFAEIKGRHEGQSRTPGAEGAQ